MVEGFDTTVRRTRPRVRPAVLLAGVVPAAEGWLVVVGTSGCRGPALTGAEFRPTLATLLAADSPFRAVGLAVPVGLPDTFAAGGRTCDRLARRLLGRRRGSAVAPAPLRPALGAATIEEARVVGPLSAATWHLLPWIREVDERLDPPSQRTVSSVHPELSFLRLGERRPLAYPKHTDEGRRERRCRVELAVPGGIEPVAAAIGPDERWRLLDAVACLCTAAEIARGAEAHLPGAAELDSTGLRMELVW
jgi:predicted RNase H-like nuclease